VIRSKKRAIANPRASYGAKLTRSEIERSEVLAPPLMRLDKASFAEAAIVMVLASERWIRRNRKDAIYIDGIAWRSATPWLEGGGIERAKYAYHSFQKASELAGLRPDLSLYDVIELDDTYSYKLLQHLHALLKKKREVRRMIDEDSSLNPSGGSLGVGNLIEATALHKMVECILQLRGVAGKLQIKDAKKALVLSWRGHPTATGGVAILSR
jgi:acetyl-CoA C-acetyltransferase